MTFERVSDSVPHRRARQNAIGPRRDSVRAETDSGHDRDTRTSKRRRCGARRRSKLEHFNSIDVAPDNLVAAHPRSAIEVGARMFISPTLDRFASPVSGRASSAAPSKSPPKPQQVDGRSISTPTPSKSSPDGAADNNATDNPPDSTIPSSPIDTANPSIPNRSANSSTARHSTADCPESGSTTCATPTRHYSSQPANPPKLCRNPSVTPTRVHDGHLPTPAAWHGRGRGDQLRRVARHRRSSRSAGQSDETTGACR